MICDSHGAASNTTASLCDLLWEEVHWADSLTGWPWLFYLHRQHWEMNSRGKQTRDEKGLAARRSQRQEQTQCEWSEEAESFGRKNVLAVAQLDHYLLLRKCDVVEKVKVIVWKWGEGAGLILNHYHRCTAADSGYWIQGVLPWCSLELIDKLVPHLQKGGVWREAIKNTLPTL